MGNNIKQVLNYYHHHPGSQLDQTATSSERVREAKDVEKELAYEYAKALDTFEEGLYELSGDEADFLPITTRAYLYLSGTPFKALATGEFIEEQIFNWTYTDEQRAKQEFAVTHPDEWNPYAALPEMRLLTYQLPDELVAIASRGEFDEFDLNEFFEATGNGAGAEFAHKGDVQKWLGIIRGAHLPTQAKFDKAQALGVPTLDEKAFKKLLA